MRKLIVMAAAALLASLVAAKFAMAMDRMPDMPGMTMPAAHAPLPGASLYNLEGQWQNTKDAAFPLTSLRGGPVVAAMVFTHCPDVCPLVTHAMQRLEETLPAHSCARFALFSLDWVRDTPGALSHYAVQHGLGERRWTLLHGDEAAVRELAAALGVSFFRQPNGDFQHSIAVYLLDTDGKIAAEESDLNAVPAVLKARLAKLDTGRCK